MKRNLGYGLFVCAVVMVLAGASGFAWAQSAAPTEAQKESALRSPAIAIAISLAVGLACLGAGIAVGRVGAAALGAASERPELLVKSLALVGLAEGIAIFGFVIAILLLRELK
jgi:V/A-type H+/Na+-transporting ATPase subunit K